MTATYEETQIQLLAYPIDEKWAVEQDDLVNSTPRGAHTCCRDHKKNVWRKVTLAALFATFLTLLSFLAMTFLCPPELHALLFKRQNNSGTTTTNGNQSAFTEHKLWIIIIVVVGIFQLFKS